MSLESIDPAIVAIGGGVLLLLVLLLARLRRRGSQEPDYLTEVRRFVARGDFRRAGEIQLRHGHVQEAYNLFERGSVHDRAADCAERLGLNERAALQAEKAGQLGRAGRLYLSAGLRADAARLFQRVGNFLEAAEALEGDLLAPPLELAQLWENAFLDTVPAEGESVTPSQLSTLHRTAERAAENYKRAGENERAAHFYELCDRDDTARTIREHLPSHSMDNLDRVRDRLRVRLRTAMETATTADYAFAPAVEDGAEDGLDFPEVEPLEPTPDVAALPSQHTDLGLPTPQGTLLGMPSHATASGDYRAPAVSGPLGGGFDAPGGSGPVAPTTLLDARTGAGQAVGESGAVLIAGNLPPEADDAEVFPAVADDRAAIEVLGLDSDDLGQSAAVFDSPALRQLLDPSGGRDLELLEPSGPYGSVESGSYGAYRVGQPGAAEQSAIPTGDRAKAPINEQLVSAVVDEVLKRRAEPPASPGFLPPDGRPGGRRSSSDVPTGGRFEVIHRSEAPGAPSVDLSVDADRYQLLERLGEGGMGVVHRARDNVLDRDVALKLLPEGMTSQQALLGLFEQEAKSAAKLNHPNIVTVHDYGVLKGQPFICMELIEGDTVTELLEPANDRGLQVLDAMRITEGLLAALDYAHQRSIIHRDIKPSNVMRTPDGTIKLMDFGIAKLMEPDKTTKIAGTPAYMAPEQMTGRGIDHRTDLFAVGATVYEMLTGKLPYEGLRRDTRVEPPRNISPAIPKRLQRIVLDCLSNDPEDRPSSAQDLLLLVRAMRRQIELYLDREMQQSSSPEPTESGSQPSVDMIDIETLRMLLKQLATPGSGDAAEAEPLFRAALTDPRAEVRAEAVQVYPLDLDPALRETVTELLDDEDEEVRVAVIDRLGSTGEHHLARMLVDRARESHGVALSSAERRALYNSLIEVAGADAVPYFESLFDDMTSPGAQTIESVEDERSVRTQLKDLMDAVARFEDGRAERLAARVRRRQDAIEEGLAAAPTPPPGQARFTPESLPRAQGSGRGSTPGGRSGRPPAGSSPPEAQLPEDVEAMLRDYLHDEVE